jgi:hypothetical protein
MKDPAHEGRLVMNAVVSVRGDMLNGLLECEEDHVPLDARGPLAVAVIQN